MTKELPLGEAALDVLDTMEGRRFGTRWTEVQIQEDTGRDEREVKESLLSLERVGRVRWQEVPFARAGWYLARGVSSSQFPVPSSDPEPEARSSEPRAQSPQPPSLEERLVQIEEWVRPRAPPNLSTSKAALSTALRIILELVGEVRRLRESGDRMLASGEEGSCPDASTPRR